MRSGSLSTAPTMSVWDFLGEAPGEDRREAVERKQQDEQLAADLVRALQGGGRSRAGDERGPDRWSEHECQVKAKEFPLTIGPFSLGRRGEVARAWIASPGGGPAEAADVTQALRRRWCCEQGVYVPSLEELRAEAPGAPLTNAVLHVKYRVSCVPSWDVSKGSYTEGIGRLGHLVPMVAKSLANVVGATLAASGYVVAKAGRVDAKRGSGGRAGRGGGDASAGAGANAGGGGAGIADSDAFLWGFSTWLRLNGIAPSVHYDPTGRDGVRLRWFLAQVLAPGDLPREVAPADDMRQTPLIVANHISYLDPVVLVTIFGAPRVIAKAGTLQLPIIGRFAREIGVIEVDRGCRDSRAAALGAIVAHSRGWKPGQQPLLLFPEGTTSNGADLLDFKKGAFVPGMPVRPVVICYTGDWNPASVNFRLTRGGEIAPTTDAEWCGEFLGHLVHSVRVRVLPPYCPSEEERARPELYAANVRELMAEAHAELQREAEASNAAKSRRRGRLSWR